MRLQLAIYRYRPKKNLKEFMMPESLETLIGFFWTLEFFSLDSSIAIVEIRHKLI